MQDIEGDVVAGVFWGGVEDDESGYLDGDECASVGDGGDVGGDGEGVSEEGLSFVIEAIAFGVFEVVVFEWAGVEGGVGVGEVARHAVVSAGDDGVGFVIKSEEAYLSGGVFREDAAEVSGLAKHAGVGVRGHRVKFSERGVWG